MAVTVTLGKIDKVVFSDDVYRVGSKSGDLAHLISAGTSTTPEAGVPETYFTDASLSSFLCTILFQSNTLYVTHVVDGVPTLITNVFPNVSEHSLTPASGASELTINNGNNLKSVTIGDTEYTNFPVSVSVSGDSTITGYGKDSPIITVDYQNTQEPVITDS